MASTLYVEDSYYMFEILEKVWERYLWRKHGIRHANGYFANFGNSHSGFQFTIIRIYDGTKHPMVTSEQYEAMKKELQRKTGVTLRDIDRPTDMKDPRNNIVERRTYSSQRELRDHWQEIMRENDEIHRRARENATEHKDKLCQTLTAKEVTTFLSYDVEVFDRDRKTMLEIGYVKFTLKEGDIPEYFHAVVNDDIHNQQGFDNKEKFRFGTTVRMTLEEAAEQLQNEISGSDALVTHSGHNDEQYLAKNGITIEQKPMFDTQVLGLNLLPSGPKSWSLKRILEKTGICFDESILHNAGNDAHYTMLAFKALVKRAMPSTRF